MDEMVWFETSLSVGGVNGACGLGFAQIKHLFHDFSTVTVVWWRLHCRADYVGTGREWIKWHRMRPQSSIGMYSELVGLDLPQINTFFHNLGAVLFVDTVPRRRMDVSLK